MNQTQERPDHAAEIRRALTDVRCVLDALGLLKGAGKQSRGYIVCCPWHHEKTPSCSVRLKDGVLVAHCFACGGGGDVLGLVAAVRGLDLRAQFKQVLAEAAEIGGLWDIQDAVERKQSAQPRPRARSVFPSSPGLSPEPEPEPAAAIEATTFRATAQAVLEACPLAGSVAVGLVSRGVLYEARLDGWGEVPPDEEAANVVAALTSKFDAKSLEWIIRGEGFCQPNYRLLIPWRAPDGTVNDIQRRWAPQYGTEQPPDRRKYLRLDGRHYRPQTRYAYGVDSPNLASAEEIWIVEGATDVLALRALNRNSATPHKLAALGIPGASSWQTVRDSILVHVKGRVVHAAFDADRAGQQAVQACLADIQSAQPSKITRPAVPRGLKDWCELSANLHWYEESYGQRSARYQRELNSGSTWDCCGARKRASSDAPASNG